MCSVLHDISEVYVLQIYLLNFVNKKNLKPLTSDCLMAAQEWYSRELMLNLPIRV